MTLHALTIALSAFLLFLVQPIIARQILPWFGGSAAVWTTCMVFFQVVLLAGYFYSDFVIRKLTPRKQAIVHTTLLLASALCLPITAAEALKPTGASHPIADILWLLTLTIGLPYLMLATTGPLVQAWFTREFSSARVYRLYALSNLASMTALIAYPPLIEPYAQARTQSIGWSVAYIAFAVLAIAAAWRGARVRTLEPAATPVPTPAMSDAPINPIANPPPAVGAQAMWLLLAGLGSVLLLAVTTHITQNVASIPFLWVLPLALYLITFILCFDGEGWYRPAIMRPLAVIACGVMLAGLTLRFGDAGLQRGLIPIRYAVPLYALGLFLTCMFVHGELVARKPSPAHLTRFYLMVSLGGAIGGLLVGIAAPLLFSWYWELPIALTIVAALGVTLSATATSLQTGRTPHLAVKLIGLLAVVGCATLLGDYVGWIRGEMREVSRNFYGTLRVRAVEGQEPLQARRQLLHGEILHGEQFTDPSRRSEPTTYYGPQSGIGQLIAAQQAARGNTPLRVGLIGVGIGTLAGYGRTGDVYRLYELNPAVFELARSQFTYLSDSAAQIQQVLGDARLMLEGEAAQRFDVLAVDAFSSDSIPVHLLTREALAVYRRHLAEQGAVAFHVTNRYLDLKGVVRRLADETGMQAVLISDEPAASHHTYRSDWIVLTAQPSLANTLRAQGGLTPQAPPAGRATWTDDHHNLFEVLK
jgi:hypothetical protein